MWPATELLRLHHRVLSAHELTRVNTDVGDNPVVTEVGIVELWLERNRSVHGIPRHWVVLHLLRHCGAVVVYLMMGQAVVPRYLCCLHAVVARES